MTCVTIPTISAMIIIRVRMASSQFGALLPFILILRNSLIIGCPSNDTTAARMM